jgi:hypothetical protein
MKKRKAQFGDNLKKAGSKTLDFLNKKIGAEPTDALSSSLNSQIAENRRTGEGFQGMNPMGESMMGVARGIGQGVSDLFNVGVQAAANFIPSNLNQGRNIWQQGYNPYAQGTGSSSVMQHGGYVPVERRQGGMRVTEEVPITYGDWKQQDQMQSIPMYGQQYDPFGSYHPQPVPVPQFNQRPMRGVSYERATSQGGSGEVYIPQFQGDWSRNDRRDYWQYLPDQYQGSPVVKGDAWDYMMATREYGGEVDYPEAKSGIHIKPENRGKFNATKKRTGKSTEELTHSSNPVTKKRAIFAQNAAKWKKGQEGLSIDPTGSYAAEQARFAPGDHPELEQERPDMDYRSTMPTMYGPTQSSRQEASDYSGQTFSKAFAEARKDLGAGKTFTWNGKSYSTRMATDNKHPQTGAPVSRAKQAVTTREPLRPQTNIEYANQFYQPSMTSQPLPERKSARQDLVGSDYDKLSPYEQMQRSHALLYSRRQAKGEQPGVSTAKKLLLATILGTTMPQYEAMPLGLPSPRGTMPPAPTGLPAGRAPLELPAGAVPRGLPQGPSPLPGGPVPQSPLRFPLYQQGGPIGNVGDELDLSPEEIRYYESLGYQFE